MRGHIKVERNVIYLQYKKEYQPIELLEGDAAIYFNVPISIIENTEMLSIRLSLFSYLSVYRGLNNRMCFSVPLFLEWAGYKSDAHRGGINDKVLDTLNEFCELGYIVYTSERPLTRSSFTEIEFNRNLVYKLGNAEGFAILYWDEVQKIMQYKNINPQDKYLNRNTILLVFAFLRQSIFRTPNELKPEEQSPDGIAERKKRCIEAYNGNYKDISATLGLSNRTVSSAVKVLVQLQLIITAEAYHVKNEDGEYRTPDIIFVNAYKREKKELLAIGESYYLDEIKRKAEKLRLYFPQYHVHKINFI